jgi:hypothetical protein
VIDVVPLLVTLKVPVNPVPHTFSEYAAVHPAAALAAVGIAIVAAASAVAPSSPTVTDAAYRRSFLMSLTCIFTCTSRSTSGVIHRERG